MKPRNPIYLGDHNLEPPEDDEPELIKCECCSGNGVLARMTMDGWEEMECPECKGSGEIELTEAERQQKAFDDFDPPDDGDFGDPL